MWEKSGKVKKNFLQKFLEIQEGIYDMKLRPLADNNYMTFLDKWKDFINDNTVLDDDTLYQFYQDELLHLKNMIKEKKLIYRKVMMNIQDIKTEEHITVGLFWTDDKSVLSNFTPTQIYDDRFDMMGSTPCIFTAVIPDIEHIDMDATIAHRISVAEGEIRLFPDVVLDVVNVKGFMCKTCTYIS